MASESDRLEWYLKAKFGLFIHWGPYSVAGVEASWPIMAPELAAAMFGTQERIMEADYRSLPDRFNPVKFDADEWVRMAIDAGMRYMVFTAKHHDGFCMFDAPGTAYKIINTPFGRDICKELAEACARHGLRLGFYYSPPDMDHPGYRDTSKPARKNWLGEPDRKEWSEYLAYMEEHLRTLLTGYGDVSVIWFDALVNHAKYDPQRFRRLIHELSPATLVNDRLGRDYDFITPEQYIPRNGIPVKNPDHPSTAEGGEGLFRMIGTALKIPVVKGMVLKTLRKYGEGEMDVSKISVKSDPTLEEFQPWETCMTMNKTWGYNPSDNEWKSPEQLITNLRDVVAGRGNFLLNVGPAPDGTFPPEAVECLRAVGRWVSENKADVFKDEIFDDGMSDSEISKGGN